MARDYRETVRALRAKAADPVVPEPERKALLERANEIERNHNISSRPTNDTTVTSRDGRGYTPTNLDDLIQQYWHQRPSPSGAGKSWYRTRGPDPDDLIADNYKFDTADEDYGYDIFEGSDW